MYNQNNHNLEVVKGTELFINNTRDVILFPYRIDLTEREFKSQIWFASGGVASEWLELDSLKDYEIVNYEDIKIDFRNFDEPEIMQVFDLYDKKPVHEEALKQFKNTLDKLKHGDVIYITFRNHSSFEYEFTISNGKFYLTPLRESNGVHKPRTFDFGGYNRKEFEEYLIARFCIKEIKNLWIVEQHI